MTQEDLKELTKLFCEDEDNDPGMGNYNGAEMYDAYKAGFKKALELVAKTYNLEVNSVEHLMSELDYKV